MSGMRERLAEALRAAIHADPSAKVLDARVWDAAADWYADALLPTVEAMLAEARDAAWSAGVDDGYVAGWRAAKRRLTDVAEQVFRASRGQKLPPDAMREALAALGGADD